MKTSRHATERAQREAFWQPHIDAWQSTDLAATEYCQQHHLNHHQFKYWQYQLAPETKKTSRKKATVPFFVECTTPTISTATSSPYLEVNTVHGFSIVLQAPLPAQQLAELLSAVKQLAC